MTRLFTMAFIFVILAALAAIFTIQMPSENELLARNATACSSPFDARRFLHRYAPERGFLRDTVISDARAVRVCIKAISHVLDKYDRT